MTAHSDVLVVGAGPTGLSAALAAMAHGASVRIIDRRTQQFRPSRAMMLHARALECLRPLGVTAHLLDRADTAPEARLHLGTREVRVRLGHVDLPDTAFPHLTLMRQADVEDVLRAALQARGVHVEWGVEFRGVSSAPAEGRMVEAELNSAERGPEAHQARFIAGCDGQPSTVRGLIGSAWRGAPYPVEAILADVELSGDLEPGLLHVAVGASGLAFLFALGEGATWRMLATRPASPGPTAEFGQLGPSVPCEVLGKLLADSGLPETIDEVRWSAQVPLQHRVASRFRHGPLFIAGDAAHAHSPAGGQGMNNGILDAVNLGWKLGFASHREDSSELLASYEAERRPAAREVLALTHLLFFGEASPHPVARLARSRILPHTAAILPALLRQKRIPASAVRLLAQPFVRYRRSPISRDGTPSAPRWPHPGDRLPDQPVIADGHATRLHELTAEPGVHILLERDAALDVPVSQLSGLDGAVHSHRLSSHPGRAVVAVRPDGYVGFRCGAADVDQLRDWLRLVAPMPGAPMPGAPMPGAR